MKLIDKAFAKEQGEDWGKDTQDLLGQRNYEAPNFIPGGDLAGAIANWANVLTGLAAIIAVGALTWGGIVWAMSAGDEEKISQAKSIIKYSIFGLILSLSAWVIVGMVVNNVG